MLHVAILKPNYIREILAGRKTIESRLTKTRQPPHGRVAPGERLFLKASGGPFMAMAIAGEVLSWDNLSPTQYKQIEERYRVEIGGDDAYWEMKRDSRCATLIRLCQVEPIDVGPKYKIAYMKAWYVLDASLNPVRDRVLTEGAIRNRYASLPQAKGGQRQNQRAAVGRKITLELPGNERVETEFAQGRMLRWRGWGKLYDAADAKPGDLLRFVAVGPNAYRVSIHRTRA
ncbi:ASCH domain-containing protein [Phycisphaeraceae bacterium D3-23]